MELSHDSFQKKPPQLADPRNGAVLEPTKTLGSLATSWNPPWARELGTICPFGVFSLFYSNFWPNLRPIHVVMTFSLVLWAFQVVLGSWNAKSTICPFRARKWPFQAHKTLRFKGKMANFEAKNAVKQGKKRQKDKWYPIRACTPPPRTRVKWVPFVLLAFLPLFYSICRFKIGHFPFKTQRFGSLKRPFSGPKKTNVSPGERTQFSRRP